VTRSDSSNGTEAQLVVRLLNATSAWLRVPESRLSIQSEVTVGSSIADVVVLVHGRVRPAVEQPLTIQEAVVVSSLRQNGATRIDVLEERCGLERMGLRHGDSLARLSSWKIVQRSSGGRIALKRTLAGQCRLIAIEAKLLRWRRALEQAVAYRRYADTAYVALPEAIVGRNSIDRQTFLRSGVGLLSVSENAVSETISPSRSTAHDWRREYVLSRMALSVGGDTNSPVESSARNFTGL